MTSPQVQNRTAVAHAQIERTSFAHLDVRKPIAYGRYIACNGQATKQVWVESNGVLGAYIVVDSEGRQVCENPMIWNQFRGETGYIVCN